ncbi:MAG: IS110 family transposase [Gammaproteobacteria bacterium]|nr:IS110 family transposase [Gammaproteobacteria bacterium]
MTTDVIALGVDISKKKFDVALLKNDKLRHKTFKNETAGFEYLLEWLEKQDVTYVHVCQEATGCYGEALAEFLFDAGFAVSIVNPARVKGYALSQLKRSKTDKQDAGLIARFCAAMGPELWQPQPKEIRQLRDLVRRLEALNDMRQQELNRLEAAIGIVKEQVERHVSFLDKEIKETKNLINQHIDNHPELKERKQLLESIPGIGSATINVVLSEFGDITQFRNAKALAAFIGVAPRVRQSGTSLRERGMMSKMGRRALRKAFFMPALVALRYNPSVIELKQRLTEAGKAKMAIVGAAMRKLIHIIYGVLKNGVPYDAKFA